jgi:predicted membrane-bound spermidine synthase
MRPFFAFFFVSGFCSILYELVWLRLAMAQFAVTTALVSIVLSAFMIGLGLGSWGAGRYMRSRAEGGGFGWRGVATLCADGVADWRFRSSGTA